MRLGERAGSISSYQKIKVIGSGTYSQVYKGINKLTNQLVALKEISLQRDEGVPFTAIREISLLKELKHSNVITLHDYIYSQRILTLVFEYLDYDLAVYMSRCDYKLDPENVKLFLFQLLRGIKYCHDKRILHRDMKPQNLLLNSLGELKLADFGLARAKSVPIKTFTDEVVTLWYRPPDVLLGNTDYGASIDIWGIGCIFYEMSCGKTLFTGTSPQEQLKVIFESIGIPSDTEWALAKDELTRRNIHLDVSKSESNFEEMLPHAGIKGVQLLKSLLRLKPELRLSSHDALAHGYFKSLPQAVHSLSDSESVFSINSIRMKPDKITKAIFNLCTIGNSVSNE